MLSITPASPRPLPSVRAGASPELLLGLQLNAFLVAMMIGGMEGVFPVLSALALIALAAMVAWVVRGLPSRYSIDPLTTFGSLLLCAAVVLGYVVNLERFEPAFMVGNVASTFIAFGMAYLLASRLDLDWRALIATHAVVAFLLLPVPISTGTLVWGRLVGHAGSGDIVHPNFLGMIALLGLIGAFGLRRAYFKVPLIMAAALVMLATSSRASLACALVAAAAYGFCAWTAPHPHAERGRRTLRAATTLLVLVLTGAIFAATASSTLFQAADAVFKVTDPYRGIASGGSGRAELWQAALAIWASEPLLGVGFRGHSALMPGGNSAHSGYLSTLADVGVLGLAGYLLIFAGAVAGLWKSRHDPARHTAIALVASYLAYGVVESRALAFGNPYSILFLWIAYDVGKRHLAAHPRANESVLPTTSSKPAVLP
jgi:O-antigen ligase